MNKHFHALCIPLSLLRLRVEIPDKWIHFTYVVNLISISADYAVRQRERKTQLCPISIGTGHRTEASLLTGAAQFLDLRIVYIITFVLRCDTLLD